MGLLRYACRLGPPVNGGKSAANKLMGLGKVGSRITWAELTPPSPCPRGSFQCLVGNCVAEDIFLSLVENFVGFVAHGFSLCVTPSTG
jgi:hypothetical protein